MMITKERERDFYQECKYCWRQFKSSLDKCPFCGKEVGEVKEEESFFKKFRKKWSNQ